MQVPARPWHHPSLFGRLTPACTPTNPYSQYPSPCPFRTRPVGTRRRRGPQPTPRGNIDTGASESIGGSVGARLGAVARPVDVWDCAAARSSLTAPKHLHPRPTPLRSAGLSGCPVVVPSPRLVSFPRLLADLPRFTGPSSYPISRYPSLFLVLVSVSSVYVLAPGARRAA